MNNRTAENFAGKRIAALLDEGSFVEIGREVTARATDFNMQAKETPSDGVITGYGVIDGNLVYVYSQDAEVLNGSIGEMHAKKIAHIYDMAMKMGAPVIGMIDCAGLRLQEASDALNGFGELYLKQTMASGVIPLITAVFGTCGGGLAVVPALSDFTFIENKGRIFINSPNAIPGSTKEKCDTSSASFQEEETGLIDLSGTEEEIFEQIRTLVCMIPASNEDNDSYEECTDELNRLCEEIEQAAEDPGIVLPMISDSGVFFETKKNFAKEMVTGFIRLNGMTVGAVANRTVLYDEEGNVKEEFADALSARGCRKAADFVNFCDAFNIPVVDFVNASGFKASKCSEKNLAREAGRLVYAFANATVPKVSVVTKKAFGSAYVIMNSKAIGADIVYAWPEAKIGMMDAALAAKIICAGEDASVIREKTAAYEEMQNSPVSAARRGYVDTLIDPRETRKYLIGAFEMLFTKREDRPAKKHGTV